MFTLIENGELYVPEPVGIQSLLIANERIAKIGKVDGKRLSEAGADCEVVDATGCVIVPGFIDPHSHLIGAAGENGFGSRTPEIPLSQLASAGITTVIGVIGTDTTTRHMTTLLAKVRELEAYALTSYMYTGGFQLPPVTITSDVKDDLILIDKILGVGEIAISDVRSVEPTLTELASLISQSLIGGMISGKAGVTHFHVGPGKRYLKLLHQLLDDYDIPAECVYPTHVSRSRDLMDDAIRLSQRGAYVDIDAVEENVGEWLSYYLQHEGVANRLTVSSDAHTAEGRPAKFYAQFVSCLRDYQQPLDQTLRHFTSNAADVLKLHNKGRLKCGMDADMLILEQGTFEIRHVFSKGHHMVIDEQVVVKTRYEDYALSSE
jgi:beta-aspartyl-dipeptidase (metallo-type)